MYNLLCCHALSGPETVFQVPCSAHGFVIRTFFTKQVVRGDAVDADLYNVIDKIVMQRRKRIQILVTLIERFICYRVI